MKLYIESNTRYGKGYQVRAEEGGETDIIAFHPYSLSKAVIMAQKAAHIRSTKLDRRTLTIDRDSITRNKGYDYLTDRMVRRLAGG